MTCLDGGRDLAHPVIAAAQVADIPPDIIAGLFKVACEFAGEIHVFARITDEDLLHNFPTLECPVMFRARNLKLIDYSMLPSHADFRDM